MHHLIWKRPDGLQSSAPQDFRRIALSNGAYLWIHIEQPEWYPFQISGDWSGQSQTQRLNALMSILNEPNDTWVRHIERMDDAEFLGGRDEGPTQNMSARLVRWLESLKTCIKGHTWEADIVKCALCDAQSRLNTLKMK